MSLFHDCIDLALVEHKLTQNELRVHLALLRQTLGYGKAKDAISNRQLCDLSGLRSDRMQTAVQGLLEKGLWQREKHRYFDYVYHIPPELKHKKVITPAVSPAPETQKSDAFPSESASRNSGSHIQTNLTNKTLHTVDPRPKSKPQPKSNPQSPALDWSCVSSLSAEEQQQAKRLLKPLPTQDSNDCLKLFKLEFDLGKVRKPLAYLYALVKAAKRGALDRSALRYHQYQQQAKPSSSTTPKQAAHAKRIAHSNQKAEREHLRTLAKLAGVPLSQLLPQEVDHAFAV